MQVTIRSSEGSLQVNSKIKGAVQRSNVNFAPIDVGNTHPNFEAALYQNRRLAGLFSTQVEILASEYTGVNLLDLVTLNVDKSYTYLKAYTGEYRVASRAIRIQDHNYFEKLGLLRKTINSPSINDPSAITP